MKILSADPGETTGVTILDGTSYSFWQIDCRSLYGFFSFLRDVAPDAIVYEDFKHRPGLMKAELYSMQVIGVIRLYAEATGTEIRFKCLPAEAKAFWDDAKIKKLSLWEPGKKHAMDSLRVLLKYKEKTDPLWYQQMLQLLKQ